MKKLLAILVAGAFATSAFAVEASAPAQGVNNAPKHNASSSKHHKKHSKKHTKKHASSASM